VIYLLSQMSFIILLALIAGGALGWGFQRMQNSRKVSNLRRKIAHQQQLVKQAQTEVNMAAEDYDELKQLSSQNIETLRSENRQIPNLHQNLEKSQLLVRQLMQKHELQIRQYGSENESLKNQLKHLDDRESAINRLQSDVERERREINDARKALDQKPLRKTVESANPMPDATVTASHTAAAATERSKPLTTEPKEINATSQTVDDQTVQAQPHQQPHQQSQQPPQHREQLQAHELEQALKRELEQPQVQAPEQSQDQLHKQQSQDRTMGITSASDQSLDMSADVSDESGSLTVALAEADEVLAAIDKKRDNSVTIEDDEVIDTSDLVAELEFAHGDDTSNLLFDPVDQHDDLQTIFGIGPIFERSLNELGITSYSQLAELKHHDIEKLAVALEIVPGKIERENWVGNARRQLEDVLEEL